MKWKVVALGRFSKNPTFLALSADFSGLTCQLLAFRGLGELFFWNSNVLEILSTFIFFSWFSGLPFLNFWSLEVSEPLSPVIQTCRKTWQGFKHFVDFRVAGNWQRLTFIPSVLNGCSITTISTVYESDKGLQSGHAMAMARAGASVAIAGSLLTAAVWQQTLGGHTTQG